MMLMRLMSDVMKLEMAAALWSLMNDEMTMNFDEFEQHVEMRPGHCAAPELEHLVGELSSGQSVV